MADGHDFERVWLSKFALCLEEGAGQNIRAQVLAGSEALSPQSGQEAVLDWTRQAMARLDGLTDEATRRTILSGCACQFPKADLAPFRAAYACGVELEQVQRMLQAGFEGFLRNSLGLAQDLVAEIVRRGWGWAGLRQGDAILATKIPRSGFLVEYMAEPDPEQRRRYYCHCPRVRELVGSGHSLSPTYCYCGAGFYRGMWEEILQMPVQIEVVQSVMQGDDRCTFSIQLPVSVWAPFRSG